MGFRRKAQGCEARATFGHPRNRVANPNGLVASVAMRCHNPVGVGVALNGIPRVARASQPWAGRHNPFGIGRIITADTQTVLVDQALAKRIESRDRTQFPSWRDIMQNSVQIWASRLDPGKLPVKPVGPESELWAWIGNYDNFLGYMAGVLPLLKAGKTGFEPL